MLFRSDGRISKAVGPENKKQQGHVFLTEHTVPNTARDELHCFALSPDNREWVAGMMSGKILRFDATTFQALPSFDLKKHMSLTVDPICIAYSTDSNKILIGTDSGPIYAWDLPLDSFEKLEQNAQDFHTYDLACSPDGKEFMSCSGDGSLVCWDAKSLKRIGIPWVGQGHRSVCLAYSPDSTQVVSGSNSENEPLIRWSRDGKALQRMKGPQCSMISITFAPHRKEFISLGLGSDEGSLACRWRDFRCVESLVVPKKTEARALAYSPRGDEVYLGTELGDIFRYRGVDMISPIAAMEF